MIPKPSGLNKIGFQFNRNLEWNLRNFKANTYTYER